MTECATTKESKSHRQMESFVTQAKQDRIPQIDFVHVSGYEALTRSVNDRLKAITTEGGEVKEIRYSPGAYVAIIFYEVPKPATG
jgi:hypothetical protein